MADYPFNWNKPVIDDTIANFCIYTEQNDEHLMRALTGYVNRAKFTWSTTASITIGPGVYHHAGTKDQLVWWTSDLTYTFTGVGTSEWRYIYIDDSAIVTLGANELTATQITNSTTAPTWTAAAKGWYNGSDRCIGAVRIDGSGNVVEFFHSGSDFLSYADTAYLTSTPSSTWTDVDLSTYVPGFSTEADVNFYGTYADTATSLNYRTNGQTGTTGHQFIITVSATAVYANNMIRVVTDSSQIIEIKWVAATANATYPLVEGWYFPRGM